MNHELFHTIELMMTVTQRMADMENQPRDFGTGDLLHRAEIHTLQAIGDLPGVGVTELADHLGITKGAVSQMVRKLEAKGLAERTYSKDNARDVRLLLTPVGRKARDGHMQFHNDIVNLIRNHFKDRFHEMNERFKAVFTELNTLLDAIEKSHITL